MNTTKKIHKKILCSLYLNALSILAIALFRFKINESFDFILIFALILLAIFTLYGLRNKPSTKIFYRFSIIFNVYSITLLLLIGIGRSTDLLSSIEASSAIAFFQLILLILAIVSAVMTLNLSRTKKK